MAALEHVGCPVSRNTFEKFPVECGYDIIAAANSFFKKDSNCFFEDKHEFWSLFGEEFWSGLPVSDEMVAFMDWSLAAVGLKNVYILTSATGAEGCLEGKRKWVLKYLGRRWLQRLITCKDKFVCAHNSLLIDDSEENVKRFIEEGGSAILVPRPWNSLNGADALAHVKLELAKEMKRIQ